MSISEEGYSKSLGQLDLQDIKEDMNYFSKIAKEIDTTPESVLLYIIAQKLNELLEPAWMCKDSLDTIMDTIEDIKSED